MNWSLETLLIVHVATVAAFLIIVAIILFRRGLFRWTTAGFWAWGSFALYYALNPFFALIQGEPYFYEPRLAIAGGAQRGIWILIVALFGMTAFFVTYLRSRSGIVTWRLQGDRLSTAGLVCMGLFIMIGLFSMLTLRFPVFSTGREVEFGMGELNGRYVGQVTGYEDAAYMFLLVPIIMFSFSNTLLERVIGYAAGVLFVILALPNGWSRFVLVSVFIALSLTDAARRKSNWPRLYFLPLIMVFALILQIRGHTEWNLSTSGTELGELSNVLMTDFGSNIGSGIGSGDAGALGTWYLESYMAEYYWGYSYGLPIINYALTGWIPYRFFPKKYFLIDWLSSRRIWYGQSVDELLRGSKSTLFGSFYCEGGWVGVLILAALAGFLSRKMDGMLSPASPLIVRSTGVAWMSLLWMIWQSSANWTMINVGILTIPTLFIWLLSKKTHRTNTNLAPSPIEAA